jgi:hypothetical protein
VDAIETIKVTDYYERPELTLALSTDYTPEVDKWAIAEVTGRSASQRPAPLEEERRLLPYRVLAANWTIEAQNALQQAICAGGERRRLAIVSLARWGDSLHLSLLNDFATQPSLSTQDEAWLRAAAAVLAARGKELEMERRAGSKSSGAARLCS